MFGITPSPNRSSHSLDHPFQPLHERSAITNISNRSYGSRECLHAENRGEAPTPGHQNGHGHDTNKDMPYYLNMNAEERRQSLDRESSCEYSHPYDYLTKESRWRSSAPGLDEVPHPFVLRACQDQDDGTNRTSHRYVNDSVARLKGRKLSKKLSHGQMLKGQFSFKKKTQAHATPSLPVAKSRTNGIVGAAGTTGALKPALKPKPDIRGKQMTGVGPIGGGGNPDKSVEFTSSSPGAIPKYSKRRTVRRGISVPTLVDDEQPPRPDIYNNRQDDRHVYQNQHIGRPGRTTRVAKARSVDMFGAV